MEGGGSGNSNGSGTSNGSGNSNGSGTSTGSGHKESRRNSTAAHNATYILGIDVGTTSVKVCLLNAVTRDVLLKNIKDTLATTPSELGVEGDKQDVAKIYSALHACISRISKEQLRRVVHIAVCGQMHGVVFWRQGEAWTRNTREQLEVGGAVSGLYTWQDGRCSPEYLSTLPKPSSHLTLNSGYGCATTFWLLHNKPQFLQQYNRFGTVMDFFVAMILEMDSPIMTDQNAASFGYFNTISMEWNTALLQKVNFPTQLLPQVIPSSSTAGDLPKDWFDIPAGTPVSAAMGDLQCSVMSTLEETDTDAVINVSTSAQMAFIQPKDFQPKLFEDGDVHQPVEYFPYFQERYIAVAASMTGGNALAAFIKMIQQWVIQLGVNVPQSKIWETALSCGMEERSVPSIDILPTIYGERHCPNKKGTVHNINQGNLGLGAVTRSVCRGIIANLAGMMSPDMLKQRGVTRIVGSGACLIRNQVLQREIQELYKLPVMFVEEGNACIGAATAVADRFYSSGLVTRRK